MRREDKEMTNNNNLLAEMMNLEVGQIYIKDIVDPDYGLNLRICIVHRDQDTYTCKVSDNSDNTDYDIGEELIILPPIEYLSVEILANIIAESYGYMLDQQDKREYNKLQAQ